MKTAEIIETDHGQAVRLPDEFRFEDRLVSIRRDGETIVLEPIKPNTWPVGFFETIRIDDPAFVRPPQGVKPAVPALEAE